MATNNKLPFFWSSWVQFPVQHDFPVSLSIFLSLLSGGMKDTWGVFAVMVRVTHVCAVSSSWTFRYRYCRMLEEGSFRGRTADFVFMFLFGGFLMTVSFKQWWSWSSTMSPHLHVVSWLLLVRNTHMMCVSGCKCRSVCVMFLMSLQIFGVFVSLVFLGQAFTIMLVYVWSRRNPNVRMNFFGLLNFQAPFLPWVLMGFSLLLGNSIIVDLLGTNLLPWLLPLQFHARCPESNVPVLISLQELLWATCTSF